MLDLLDQLLLSLEIGHLGEQSQPTVWETLTVLEHASSGDLPGLLRLVEQRWLEKVIFDSLCVLAENLNAIFLQDAFKVCRCPHSDQRVLITPEERSKNLNNSTAG